MTPELLAAINRAMVGEAPPVATKKGNPTMWPNFKPFTIGKSNDLYLARWFILPRNKWFNIYLHHFHRSDDDTALHDHPWRSISILFHGSYLEHMEDGTVVLRSPTWKFWRWPRRRATDAHRVELINGKKVWTLFITGRRHASGDFIVRADGYPGPSSSNKRRMEIKPAKAATDGLR